MEWISYLNKTYGIDHFAFVDDALTFNKKRFMKICEAIIKSGLKITWDCAQNAIRFDNIDKWPQDPINGDDGDTEDDRSEKWYIGRDYSQSS
jgi:hypothetical protein